MHRWRALTPLRGDWRTFTRAPSWGHWVGLHGERLAPHSIHVAASRNLKIARGPTSSTTRDVERQLVSPVFRTFPERFARSAANSRPYPAQLVGSTLVYRRYTLRPLQRGSRTLELHPLRRQTNSRPRIENVSRAAQFASAPPAICAI
ncbi:hypothetical protein C2E23DRAFT_376740 [Lenzites betulinus]|nr:hypothetical protein C2E23DRAFT_376740 [Lenzites betulinus]